MKQYLENLRTIHEQGHDHPDRTGDGRRSVFGMMTKYDLRGGKVPMVTTRKALAKGPVKEMLMFISGSTFPEDHGINFWERWYPTAEDYEVYIARLMQTQYGDDWETTVKTEKNYEEYKAGMIAKLKDVFGKNIGPMYGNVWRFFPIPTDPMTGKATHKSTKGDPRKLIASDQLRNFCTSLDITLPEDPDVPVEMEWTTVFVDQLYRLVENLKTNPFSSRHRVTSLHPAYMPVESDSPGLNVLNGLGCLAPCHGIFQCRVMHPEVEGGKYRLSLMMTQFSCDYPVGAMVNIPQYAVLAHMLAHVCDMEAVEFVHSIGDSHEYFSQKPFVEKQLTREPLEETATIWINPEVKDLFQMKLEDVEIRNYVVHPDDEADPIKYPVLK